VKRWIREKLQAGGLTVTKQLPASVSDSLQPSTPFHLVATSPEAMGACQQELSAWLTVKVADCQTEEKDISDALDIAIVRNWGTSALESQHRKAVQRVRYYTKLKAAVDAGFCIVPNFPVDLFAIRVKKDKPKQNYRQIEDASDYQDPARIIPDEKPTALAIGEGRYVSPSQTVQHDSVMVPNAKTGKETLTKMAWATEFRGVDFPLIAARPEVMDATGHAMGLNIFDAVGICPQTQKGDPLIIGKIFGAQSGWRRPEVSFLIAWHLDLRVL
jgi:hypothetical protein